MRSLIELMDVMQGGKSLSMVSTRAALRNVSKHVDESMGVRSDELRPQLSPIASSRDIGRKPLRKFGQVEVGLVMPDPNQPRKVFDEAEIQQLASSIRNSKQLHPIRVRWLETQSKWIIVTGERRWRATKAAGLSHIDCYFHDDDITDSEVAEEQLVENLLRQDLKPMEEARGYASLMELNDWNGKQVAEALRVSPSRVSRSPALLDLPLHVQQQVDEGNLPRSSAYELTKLENSDVQAELAEKAAEGALSHKQAVGAVRQCRGKKARSSSSMNQTFQADNGIKVVVRANRTGNYHEIEEALSQALEEVRLRINNNVQLF